MNLITCENVTVRFRQHGRMLLRDHVQSALSRRQGNWFYALRDVSLDVGSGEGIAILGQNGAGKSTLLGVVAGLLEPDAGRVSVSCGISLLLELGSGFHYDLTGRENLELNAAVIGFRREGLRAAARSIVEFSELESFIDQPLRTYSAGMIMRLAFAIAVHAEMNPVMLIDEILAVGDAAFQQKCRDKILAMRGQGKTMICVSHLPQSLSAICDRAIWLHEGKVVRDGNFVEVTAEYGEFMANPVRQLGDVLTP
jgi:ABC-type polysaccharide/polyol phosphate transport system ATPase subunit